MFDLKTGDLGKRNGVFVTSLESKMGLNVSATCEVNLGEKEPAVGYLLGDVHEGIAQMFKVIEFARIPSEYDFCTISERRTSGW